MQVGSSNIQDKSTLNLSILQKINFDRLANPANDRDNNGNQQKSKKKAKKQKSAAECPLSPVEKKFKRESEVEQEKVVTIDSTPTSTVQPMESVDQVSFATVTSYSTNVSSLFPESFGEQAN